MKMLLPPPREHDFDKITVFRKTPKKYRSVSGPKISKNRDFVKIEFLLWPEHSFEGWDRPGPARHGPGRLGGRIEPAEPEPPRPFTRKGW